ncbi:uncharacterized protein PHACADRAFT_260952 [Phanerochaete carnosa HHB-10118-sp]|uniref:Uncharacterized protein n=1 Tax=Phanerochaete carnosa (strain HHB-10118-sp) TaxID=650164 RepID=K5W083_PHACS|nr:uncharacterized protein PHACADRAFT_260952 [Phanerochaete carnosa HHB-10118-sp]EKM52500.1 hypothetical protein PHACADRAFT_260952 [Phanerochaete carnosa HHB-10118-sp]
MLLLADAPIAVIQAVHQCRASPPCTSETLIPMLVFSRHATAQPYSAPRHITSLKRYISLATGRRLGLSGALPARLRKSARIENSVRAPASPP